jgi:hypothetical protein
LSNSPQSEVQISAGRNLKAALIRQWGQNNAGQKIKDIDSYYYRNNRAAYKKMDADFKRTYFGILSQSEISQKLKQAAPELKGPLPTGTSGTTVVVQDGSKACQKKRPEPGLLTITTANFCVRQGKLINAPEFSSDGVFSQKGCNNGTIHTVVKISCIYYHPLCNGKVCSPNESMSGPSTTAETIWSTVSSHRGDESSTASTYGAGSPDKSVQSTK